MVRVMSKILKDASSKDPSKSKQKKLEEILLASEEIRDAIIKSLERSVEKSIVAMEASDASTVLMAKKTENADKDEKEDSGVITAKLNCGQLFKLELRKAKARLNFFRSSNNNNKNVKYAEQPSVVIKKPQEAAAAPASNDDELIQKKSATAVQAGALADGNEWSYKHAAFMLPCFDGSNPLNFANNWRNSINSCSIAFSWTDQEAMNIARLRMDGPALEWLASLEKPCTSWLEFQELFNDKFVEESDLVAKTFLALAKRRRKSAESLDEYLEAMQRLADRIQLPEKHLVQFIVNGLDDEIKTEAEVEVEVEVDDNNNSSSVTTQQRLDKVRSMDELRDYLDAFKARKAAEDALIHGLHRKKNDEDKICWNCQQRGHVYEFCRYFDNSDIWKLLSFLSMSLVVFGF